jgi:hypothetical protein
MNLCVATDVAEFKHSRGKLLSIYFVLSESLPFFTDGNFSILHFFASFLSSPPSLLLFETYSVFESGLNVFFEF